MLRNRSLWVGILTILVVPALLVAGRTQDFGKITDEEWALTAPEDFPEADAVVIFDHGEMEITSDNVEFRQHVRIKILTEAGIDLVGEQNIYYHDEYDKVKSFKAHTITPDGRKHEIDKKAVFTKEYGEYREMLFTFPQLEPGAVIEYKYRIPSERFWNLRSWYFQTNIYTLESRFTAIMSPGFEYNVAYQNMPGAARQAEVNERPDMKYDGHLRIKEFTWAQSNLPPITDEPYMSCEQDYRSSLKFQLVAFTSPASGRNYVYIEDWPKLGKDFGDGLDIYRNKRKQVREIAEEATAGLTTTVEKSQALYRYVTANYAVVGEYKSRFMVNEKLSELLETKQGSAEELNLLLTWMHDEIGLIAYPALISTRDNGHVLVENPSTQQFNHIICYVELDNGYVLLDTQSDKIPYSLLPPNCLVEVGFLIDGDKSQLVKFDVLPATSYRGDVTRVFVDETGRATCSTECHLTGYWAADYGDRYERRDPEEFARDYFLDRLPGECHLGEYSFELDTANQFVARLDFTSEDLVTNLDDQLLIQPVSFAYRSNPFKSKKRFFPVDFMYPFTYHSIVECSCADTAIGVTLPKDTSFEVPGARFVRQSSYQDGVVSIGFKMDVEQAVFPPQQYDRLREFFEGVARCCTEELAFVLAP